MRIFAIGRNYAAHIQELNHDRTTDPVVFTKPDTALLKNNAPFYLPEFSKEVHHEVEIVVKISKEGKSIPRDFADSYYEEIALGIDFTARDLQSKAKEAGLPWDIAKGFDGSAPISEFIPKNALGNIKDLAFRLDIDGEMKQGARTGLMIFDIEYLIAYLSKFFTLKKGDLIFTGTPKGVGPVKVGNRLKGYIENENMLDFEIK